MVLAVWAGGAMLELIVVEIVSEQLLTQPGAHAAGRIKDDRVCSVWDLGRPTDFANNPSYRDNRRQCLSLGQALWESMPIPIVSHLQHRPAHCYLRHGSLLSGLLLL